MVEDHSHIRKVLVLRLKELGYEVFEAETGLDEISPDAIPSNARFYHMQLLDSEPI